MKSPPVQYPDDVAHDMVADFIADMTARSAEQRGRHEAAAKNGKHGRGAADALPAASADSSGAGHTN